MNAAILSDTHFGDPTSALVHPTTDGGYALGPRYQAFRDALPAPLDYLILVGDIFDFSIVSYEQAYRAARVFFHAIDADGLLRFDAESGTKGRILYVPGNHDFEFWHQVEHEVNVIRRMREGYPPRSFRWSVPAIFDLRAEAAADPIDLVGVTRNTSGAPYGGLFLDKLTPHDFPFYVAYPNLYLVRDHETVLVTHGHYLDTFWSLMAYLGPKVFGDDLTAEEINVRDMVSLNFPLNVLACSGIGQAGPLTNLVRRIQGDAKAGDWTRVERYLDNLDDHVLDEMTSFGWWNPKEWATDVCINTLKKEIMKAVKGREGARYRDDFAADDGRAKLREAYLQMSMRELGKISADRVQAGKAALPPLRRAIYGHTHEAIAWTDEGHAQPIGEATVVFHNTGGWLFKETEEHGSVFGGAEIFLIHDDQIRSTPIA